MRQQNRQKIKKSLFDLRDYGYTQRGIGLKRSADLREWDSSIETQGTLGSCVGHAVASAYEIMLKRFRPAEFVELSRLFIYYNSREIESTVESDAGVVYLRNALKSLKLYGVCAETLWPYNIELFDDKPSPEAYADGISRQISKYESLDSITDMLEVLNLDKPIILGMDIFDGFMNLPKNNNVVLMPEDSYATLGGHAVVAVGYSLVEQNFLIKNSFGNDWGDNGYAWLPFDYVKQYVFEKWVFDIEKGT